jgi:undecaprenyl diphosphate synthase
MIDVKRSSSPRLARIPRHIGFIPDGNRRWADARGLGRHEGYAAGIEPGSRLIDACRAHGIEEVSIYGFTKENVRRPGPQVEAFRRACVEFAGRIVDRGAALLVVGDARSKCFPPELKRYTTRSPGGIRINLLVNYSWQWDVSKALKSDVPASTRRRDPRDRLGSADVSRIQLVVRWGGRQRLSGFLPMQCAYADFYSVETLWPDMDVADLDTALRWYQRQDVTIGG